MKGYILTLIICFQCYNTIVAQNEYALQFDGSNDYVDCGNPAGYYFTDLTMMCWLKTTATPGTYQALVSKDCDGCGTDFSLLVHYANTGDVNFSGDGLGEVSSGIINDGLWHFVAGTRNGDTGKIKLYIDGIVMDSTVGGTSPIFNSEKLQFGRYLPSNPHYYQGSLDEVSIWDIELTAAQIQFYMAICPTGNETGLKGYWDLDEGMGGTANDGTNNNNDGILMNGVLWSSDVPVTCIQPVVKVDNADFYIKTLTKGIIMKSPDGQCWKMTINNSGTIAAVAVTCPD